MIDETPSLPRRNFGITAQWGPRQESLENLARRLLKTVALCRPISPVFEDMQCIRDGMYRGLLGNFKLRDLAALIEEGVSRADDGDPTPVYGYYASVINGEEGSRTAILSARAGATASSSIYSNSAGFETHTLIPQDVAIFTPDFFRRVLLAIVAGWDPTLCRALSGELLAVDAPPPPIVYPGTLILPPRRKPKIGLAWMTYLGPFLARLVTPPRSALVERTPEGGLLMIATEELFSVANPQHMKVAREIEAALAPVDALPWPPGASPENVPRLH